MGTTLWLWISLEISLRQIGYYPFIEFFACLWFLAALALFITMLACFVLPTKRFLALGMLAGLVLGFFVFIWLPLLFRPI